MKHRRPKNAGPRPVTVRYYRDGKELPDFYDSQGHCKTEKGVMRGAFVRIFMREFDVARVYRDGLCTLTIKRDAHGMPRSYFGRNVLGHVMPDGSISYTHTQENDHD